MGGIGKALAALLVSIGGPILNAILDLFKAGALRRVAAWTTICALFVALFSAINALLSGITWVTPGLYPGNPGFSPFFLSYEL